MVDKYEHEQPCPFHGKQPYGYAVLNGYNIWCSIASCPVHFSGVAFNVEDAKAEALRLWNTRANEMSTQDLAIVEVVNRWWFENGTLADLTKELRDGLTLKPESTG